MSAKSEKSKARIKNVQAVFHDLLGALNCASNSRERQHPMSRRQSFAKQARAHAVRRWSDADLLSAACSSESRRLLRLLALETLFRIVLFAEYGDSPSELQHESLPELFWDLPAYWMRPVMSALGFAPETSSVLPTKNIFQELTGHYVRFRFQDFVGSPPKFFDEEGCSIDDAWPEMALPSTTEWSDENDLQVQLTFDVMLDITASIIQSSVFWNY